MARSSGLYHSLLKCQSYYHYHRVHRSGLYSDRMIHSPHCPVFRRDDGTLLEQPYFVDFVTAPAPNAGAVMQNQPSLAAQIEGVLRSAPQSCSVWLPITGVTYWYWGPGAAASSGMTRTW